MVQKTLIMKFGIKMDFIMFIHILMEKLMNMNTLWKMINFSKRSSKKTTKKIKTDIKKEKSIIYLLFS